MSKKRSPTKKSGVNKKGELSDCQIGLKRLLAEYDAQCLAHHSSPSLALRKKLRACLEADKPITQLLLHTADLFSSTQGACGRDVHRLPDDLTELYDPETSMLALPLSHPFPAHSATHTNIHSGNAKESSGTPGAVQFGAPVHLMPLLEAVRNQRYTHITQIIVWNIALRLCDAVSLSSILQRNVYPISKLELVDCFPGPPTSSATVSDSAAWQHASLSNESAEQLVSALIPGLLRIRTLSSLVLDWNCLGNSACRILCDALTAVAPRLPTSSAAGGGGLPGAAPCRALTQLSLCHCGLTGAESGAALGMLLSRSAVRSLHLNGNTLRSDGMLSLVVPLLEATQQLRERERVWAAQLKAAELAAQSALGLPPSGIGTVGELPDTSTTGQKKPGSAKKKAGTDKKKKSGKKKKKGKTGSAGPPPFPEVGPQVEQISVRDNGIDTWSLEELSKRTKKTDGDDADKENVSGSNKGGVLQLAETIVRWVGVAGTELKQLDMFGNDLGDLAAMQLLSGLEQIKLDRKAALEAAKLEKKSATKGGLLAVTSTTAGEEAGTETEAPATKKKTGTKKKKGKKKGGAGTGSKIKLPSISVGHRIEQKTFVALDKLTGGSGKATTKKKKGGKKKGGKKKK